MMQPVARQRAVWATLVFALVVLAAAAWFSIPTSRDVGGIGRSGREDMAAPIPGLDSLGSVPDFALVSQTGDTVRLVDLAGQVWIGDFIFTNCASSCPMMTAKLQELEKALAGENGVRLVSFSVDPERDTPERLAEYAAGYGARPERWLFLTGEKAVVRRLSIEGFHLPASDPTPEEQAAGAEAVLHSTRFVLVDGRGRIRGYYDGGDAPAMERLREDVRRLAATRTS